MKVAIVRLLLHKLFESLHSIFYHGFSFKWNFLSSYIHSWREFVSIAFGVNRGCAEIKEKVMPVNEWLRLRKKYSHVYSLLSLWNLGMNIVPISWHFVPVSLNLVLLPFQGIKFGRADAMFSSHQSWSVKLYHNFLPILYHQLQILHPVLVRGILKINLTSWSDVIPAVQVRKKAYTKFFLARCH